MSRPFRIAPGERFYVTFPLDPHTGEPSSMLLHKTASKKGALMHSIAAEVNYPKPGDLSIPTLKVTLAIMPSTHNQFSVKLQIPDLIEAPR